MSRRYLALGLFTVLVLLIAGRVWFSFRTPPQLPPSDEVFKTVDALFTAVTGHDTHQLTLCQQRLDQYKQRGELTGSTAKRLEGIIATAQTGDWSTAAHRLYDFIQGQRREAKSHSAAASATTAMTRSRIAVPH